MPKVSRPSLNDLASLQGRNAPPIAHPSCARPEQPTAKVRPAPSSAAPLSAPTPSKPSTASFNKHLLAARLLLLLLSPVLAMALLLVALGLAISLPVEIYWHGCKARSRRNQPTSTR